MRASLLACLLAGGILLPGAAFAQSPEATPAEPPPSPAQAAPGPAHSGPAHASPADAAAASDMRMMTVAMGAMAGYMLIAMPVTLPAIAAGAVGGLAARYWYDHREPGVR